MNGGTEEEVLVEDFVSRENVRHRRGLIDFWGKFKDRIIDLFKEEEDHRLG